MAGLLQEGSGVLCLGMKLKMLICQSSTPAVDSSILFCYLRTSEILILSSYQHYDIIFLSMCLRNNSRLSLWHVECSYTLICTCVWRQDLRESQYWKFISLSACNKWHESTRSSWHQWPEEYKMHKKGMEKSCISNITLNIQAFREHRRFLSTTALETSVTHAWCIMWTECRKLVIHQQWNCAHWPMVYGIRHSLFLIRAIRALLGLPVVEINPDIESIGKSEPTHVGQHKVSSSGIDGEEAVSGHRSCSP